jgi:hypothetical protein
VQPAVRVDGRGRVVEVAEHHVGTAQQHLAADVGDAHLEAGRGPPAGVRHGRGVVARPAHRRDHGLGQPVRGQHLHAQPVADPLDQRRRDGGRAGDREPQRGQVVPPAPGMVEQAGVEGRRPRQHGDPLAVDERHGPRHVEDRLRHDGGAADQAGQDARLEPEAVEERVDDQVAVAGVEPRDARPRLGHTQRLPVRAHRTLAAPGRAGREQNVADVLGGDGVGPAVDLVDRHLAGPAEQLGPAQRAFRVGCAGLGRRRARAAGAVRPGR